MKIRILISSLIVCGLSIGCRNNPSQTHESLKQELMNLHSIAYTGTDEQAVAAGEKALKMMDLDDVRDSDEIVKEGEDNFTFEAFDESLRIFQMALLKNKNHQKAKAYLASLTPIGHLKGIYWRLSETDNDEAMGIAILRSYQFEADPLKNQFDRFMYTPYKQKFTQWGDAQTEIFRPYVADLLKSVELWEDLHTDSALDIYLYLPKMMSTLTPLHIRNADTQAASSLSLGLATYAQFYNLYDLSTAPLARPSDQQEHHTSHTDWLLVSKDPQFGLISDKNFMNTLKGRYLQFSEGIDLAYAALKQREANKQNDPHDLSQVNHGVVLACSSEKVGTTINYESYSCHRPKEIAVPYIFSLMGDPSRIKINSKVVERNLELDPSVDDLRKEVESFKAMFFGPIQKTTNCERRGHSTPHVKFWIDLPTYLQHPIDDLKGEGPLFGRYGEFRDLTDKTVHGLFPQGMPCAY